VRRTIAITLVLLTLAALALAPTRSHAQAPNKVYRVAEVSPSATTVETFRNITLPELATLGFVEGRNLALTAHVGPPARMPELARRAPIRSLSSAS
jgi:putative tryptophan/tyrosine transport system substrate-binding protein